MKNPHIAFLTTRPHCLEPLILPLSFIFHHLKLHPHLPCWGFPHLVLDFSLPTAAPRTFLVCLQPCITELFLLFHKLHRFMIAVQQPSSSIVLNKFMIHSKNVPSAREKAPPSLCQTFEPWNTIRRGGLFTTPRFMSLSASGKHPIISCQKNNLTLGGNSKPHILVHPIQ
ncbi:unnamed protein product [Cuscuta europaea]|uniref:Uncharacterized protein n=1 Tax=Cuscuta europaea TaxID=41803 RepID=A0A9P0ZU82_CUSEU|nr:unnamed protein product [Cuscuta europaea]